MAAVVALILVLDCLPVQAQPPVDREARIASMARAVAESLGASPDGPRVRLIEDWLRGLAKVPPVADELRLDEPDGPDDPAGVLGSMVTVGSTYLPDPLLRRRHELVRRTLRRLSPIHCAIFVASPRYPAAWLGDARRTAMKSVPDAELRELLAIAELAVRESVRRDLALYEPSAPVVLQVRALVMSRLPPAQQAVWKSTESLPFLGDGLVTLSREDKLYCRSFTDMLSVLKDIGGRGAVDALRIYASFGWPGAPFIEAENDAVRRAKDIRPPPTFE